jgi:hypothetical protein
MGVNGNPGKQVTGVIEAVAGVGRPRSVKIREREVGTRYSQPAQAAKQKPRTRRGF